MDFGKVSSPSQLDRIIFTLPAVDDRACWVPTGQVPKIYLGCPIWGKKEWVGTLYPPGTSQKDYLKYYAQQFNTIEMNTTFYRIPDKGTIERWHSVVPPDFKFSPKVFQGISRFEVLKDIPDLTQRFCDAVMGLGENLGTLFMQLPPSFSPSALLILKRFFRLLPQGVSLAVEFRHPAWFVHGRLIEPAYDLLADKGVSTVITDVAGRRDVLHQSLTTKTAVVRFVGNALHPSDFDRLDKWVDRIGDWMKQGLSELSFFIHQPDEVGSLELANRFTRAVEQKYQVPLKKWNPELAKPLQSELFG